MQLHTLRALRWRSLLCVLVVAMSLGATPVSATPSTPEIETATQQANAARVELDELAAQLELRSEEFFALTNQLQTTRDEVEAARSELDSADAELDRASALLQERAVGMYRTGNVDLLEVLLGTTSLQDFLTRMDWLSRIGRNDASLVAAVKEARAQVQERKTALERREEELAALRASAKVKQAEIEQAVARQERFVAELDSEVSRLIQEEEARQRVLAEERARVAAEEAARRAAAGSAGSVVSGSRPGVDPGSLGAGRPEALDVGLKYLGVPYVWGGSTPAGFDCSGLTQYVYREIGVSIPRNSRDQFRSGSHIARDRTDLLIPGDLVFFGYDGDEGRVHHVGIYAGNGTYLHAPYTGATVRVDSLDARISSRGDYVGASRF